MGKYVGLAGEPFGFDPSEPWRRQLRELRRNLDAAAQARRQLANFDLTAQARQTLAKLDPAAQARRQLANFDPAAQARQTLAKLDPAAQARRQLANFDPAAQARLAIARLIDSGQWSHASVDRAIFDQLGRHIAQTQLIIPAAETPTPDSDWRQIANEWAGRNARMIVFWYISTLLVVVYVLTDAAAPEIIEEINRLLSTPIGLVALAYAIIKSSENRRS